MARRLSDRARRQVYRDYPHHVELSIPRDGLTRVDIRWMHRWCMEYCRENYDMPSSLSAEGTHHVLRWCFKIPEDADKFQRQFGGERVAAPKD